MLYLIRPVVLLNDPNIYFVFSEPVGAWYVSGRNLPTVISQGVNSYKIPDVC